MITTSGNCVRKRNGHPKRNTMKIEFRRAINSDLQLLGEMNKRLIEDEKHSNPISISELVKRMGDFLGGQYTAYIINVDDVTAGYCLYRDDIDYIYIRQLFVERNYRRMGLGSSCIKWLRDSFWKERKIRIEVLCQNHDGISFWKKTGFVDYCITMEMAGD
jgi:GNAT superfamily N-acetyltransferase